MPHPEVCPYWLGYLLVSPLRKLFQDPEKILGGHVRAGMTVLDVGSAMGFFSLPMARRVGTGGRVICVDMQEKMLQALDRRARRAGVADRIQLRPCAPESLGLGDLDGKIDFALAFFVVHEVPDAGKLFAEIHRALKPGAQLLVAEPMGHVKEKMFDASVAAALDRGFQSVAGPRIFRSRTALLRKGDSASRASGAPGPS
jgi:ubiquinone/menaquinone biosynthesis C-methylase UbiE